MRVYIAYKKRLTAINVVTKLASYPLRLGRCRCQDLALFQSANEYTCGQTNSRNYSHYTGVYSISPQALFTCQRGVVTHPASQYSISTRSPPQPYFWVYKHSAKSFWLQVARGYCACPSFIPLRCCAVTHLVFVQSVRPLLIVEQLLRDCFGPCSEVIRY